MRLSELKGKEVIDLRDGSRLGIYLQPEAAFDPEEGKIISILMPVRGGLFRRYEAAIPWNAIKRISTDLVLVEAVEND
ncbi:MAG TPA: YlmC/YmxH family sporulation protein [Bacillota bacterium]|nr:YlmC/YmxH family sporulation protein [Bacillota bacterium]